MPFTKRDNTNPQPDTYMLRETYMLRKLLLLPCLFAIACLFAGTYGAIHNQISYSVSSEYFTQFKFHQFEIPSNIPERVGASIVGWMAAWTMGIIIGIVIIPLGLLLPGPANYFWITLRAFRTVTLTTLAVGLAALLASYVLLDPSNIKPVSRYGNEIQNDLAFIRAGTMHDFSYLGGTLGILTGTTHILLARRRLTQSHPPQSHLTESSPQSRLSLPRK